MPELESELYKLREQLFELYNRLTIVEERLKMICKDLEKQEVKNQRVPVLLLGAISATSGAVSVLFQLWISKGP